MKNIRRLLQSSHSSNFPPCFIPSRLAPQSALLCFRRVGARRAKRKEICSNTCYLDRSPGRKINAFCLAQDSESLFIRAIWVDARGKLMDISCLGRLTDSKEYYRLPMSFDVKASWVWKLCFLLLKFTFIKDDGYPLASPLNTVRIGLNIIHKIFVSDRIRKFQQKPWRAFKNCCWGKKTFKGMP